jgi:hypothetical protein
MSNSTPAQPGTLTKRSATGVGVASIVAAGVGYAVMVGAAKLLDKPSYADFLTFWSMLFAVFGVLAGLQNETTRSVRHAFDEAVPDQLGVRVMPIGLAVGAALGACLAATATWWAPAVLGHFDGAVAVAVVFAAVAYSGHATLSGALGGGGRWPTYAVLIGSEATVRLVLVAVTALLIGSSTGLEVATAVAAGTWLVVVALSPTARGAARTRADVAAPAFVRRVGHALIAAASSAVLVVGFPVVLRLTSSADDYRIQAPLLLAISLTRAPLLIPLGAYQGVAISHFVEHRRDGLAALRTPVLAVFGVGAFGAGLAYLIGPWLMSALVRADYRVDGSLLAGLTFAASLLALLVLTGASVLALDRHTAYSAGWLVATATSVLVLLTPWAFGTRTVASLAVGPLAGIAVHAVAIIRTSRNDR